MSKKYLRRYTGLSSLIYILVNKKLSLLNPAKWEDKNDATYLKLYGEKRRYQSIYALCFTTVEETSHHWKVFAPGSHGVCIKLDKKKFLRGLDGKKGIRKDRVRYMKLNQIEDQGVSIDRMPFIKRHAFRDEKEYRVIYQNKKQIKGPSYDIPFDVDCIDKIYLSNSLPAKLRKPICNLIRSIDGCSGIDITRTSLNENARWKTAGEKAT